MPDFVRTVTIPLDEYEQLRRDATAARDQQATFVRVIREAYTQFASSARITDADEWQRRKLLSHYLGYVDRMYQENATPMPFDAWCTDQSPSSRQTT